MNIQDVVSSALSDNVIQSAVTLFAIVFILGMFLQPYQNLPDRVNKLESSDIEMRSQMLEQERKLDLVVCFLETEANGGNPLSCSR